MVPLRIQDAAHDEVLRVRERERRGFRQDGDGERSVAEGVQNPGGAVQAVVSGKKELKALTIQPDAVDPQDVEMLQDLVISAVNEALRQADEAMNNSMNSFTGGLNIPGLM